MSCIHFELAYWKSKINDLHDEGSKKYAPIYTIDGVWEKLKIGARNRSVRSTNVSELSK
jgi:hypothetical protein